MDGNSYPAKLAKDYQDYLCGLLQIILVKVGEQVDSQLADNIVKLLVQIFQHQKKVIESGLIVYSGLINGVGKRINVVEFGSYIAWALKGDEDDLIRLSCGIVSDLAIALTEAMGKYLSEFVPPLFEILKRSDQDRQSKLQAL